MNYQLTIIIPVYNEVDNLLRLEKELLNYLKIAKILTKVLFINDGSLDDSQTIIEDLCNKHDNFEYILLSKNFGLSTALKVGFDHSVTTYIGYMDADLQTSPSDFNVLLNYKDDYDLITGIRQNRKDKMIKKLSSKIANVIRRLFTQDGVIDTGCPLKLIKTDFAKRIPMFKGMHRFIPALILILNGTVKQVPVQHFPRRAGSSKFGIKKRLISPLIDCFAFLWIKYKMINYTIEKKS